MSNILKAFKKASTPALLGFSVLASTVPQASANELLTNFTDYVTKHGSVSLDADGVDVGVYKPTDNISIRVQQGFDPALPGVSVGHYKKTSVGDLNTSIGVNQHASVGGFHEPDIQINNFAEFVDEAVKGTENDANNLQARFSNVFDAQSHHYNGLTIKLDNEIYGAKIAAGLTNDGETFLFGRGIVTKNIDVDTSLAAGASIAHVGDSTDIDGIASIRHRVLGIPVGDETIATVTGQVSHNMQSGNTDYGFEGSVFNHNTFKLDTIGFSTEASVKYTSTDGTEIGGAVFVSAGEVFNRIAPDNKYAGMMNDVHIGAGATYNIDRQTTTFGAKLQFGVN